MIDKGATAGNAAMTDDEQPTTDAGGSDSRRVMRQAALTIAAVSTHKPTPSASVTKLVTMAWVTVTFFAAVASALVPTPTDAGEGVAPVLLKNYRTHFRVAEKTKGYKLLCPISTTESSLPLMIEWRKDGEVIGSDWDRFRIVREGLELKIRRPKAPDSGRYTCEAVNGFGVQTVDFTLVVYDEDEESSPPRHQLLPEPLYDMEPRWVNPGEIEQMTEAPIVKRVQSSLQLNCMAIGKPVPTISWRKDGRPLSEQVHLITLNPATPWLLEIQHLTEADSGQYTCVADNSLGRIMASFLIRVTDADQSPPEFDEQGNPLNSTVHEGQTATFQCKVRSAYPPLIRWLKMVEDAAQVKDNSTVITANGMDLLVLDRFHSTTETKGDVYLNRLVIPSVSPANSGVYICVVTNPAGHMVYRSAHLNVLSAQNGQPISSSFMPVHLIVGVPIIALFMVMVGYFIYFLQRHKQRCEVLRAAKRPPPPQRPPPSLPNSVYKSIHSPLSSSNQPSSTRYVPPNRAYYPGNMMNHHGPVNNDFLTTFGRHHNGSRLIDPSACTPLTYPDQDYGRGDQDYCRGDQDYCRGDQDYCRGGDQQQQQQLEYGDEFSQHHHYEPTPSPYWALRQEDSDYDSDINYPNGRLQPYPSVYSCR